MKNLKRKSKVAIIHDTNCKEYPDTTPFDPPIIYPEYTVGLKTDKSNLVYDMVRNLLIKLDLDKENFGKKNWNPFKKLIFPKDKVVIKPNLVKHFHPADNTAVLSSITHGSILRPIIDYVNIALKGNGKIIICDTPLEKTNFDEILKITGIGEMANYLRDVYKYQIDVLDLREYRTYLRQDSSFDFSKLQGDPEGYCTINLGRISEFTELDSRPQNYLTLADHSIDHFNPFINEIGVTNNFHKPGRHEYLIAKTILDADVIISVPKLKTHKKAGVTLNLKNMIGIVPGKVYLPHHRPGSPPYGDSFPVPPSKIFLLKRKIKRKIKSQLSQLIRGEEIIKLIKNAKKLVAQIKLPSIKNPIEWGDWYGNDTLWRTILDLNKILLYANKQGKMTSKRQRRYFSIIDGVIGQEGEGPMSGNPKICSLLLGGNDGVAVDTIAAILMGFDPSKIKTIEKTKTIKNYWLGEAKLNNIVVKNNEKEILNFRFKAPYGWLNHIELEKDITSEFFLGKE
ncbi:DUF362 domain-containing protein [bacterium]|nr:MAG: DUF362 domain-containing protein [bacterium]